MITTLTLKRLNEQLTLTMECGPFEELRSLQLLGNAEFREPLEAHLATASRHFDGIMSTCQYAATELGLHLTAKHEGEPPDLPQDVIFD
ncbi:hypothetical protein [Verrucomicrobium spinosum]|uniref:hypothetical protein n=1 Tax=Verrucomicrobium spinosum TaxID=2736 RepID=UPI0001746BC7|nr:hypothetical protein [Verrucomicrobium spinosum]